MGRTAPRSDGRSECVSERARVTGEKATELVGVLGGGAGRTEGAQWFEG